MIFEMKSKDRIILTDESIAYMLFDDTMERELDDSIKNQIDNLKDKGIFDSSKGQVFSDVSGEKFRIFVGLGNKTEDFDLDDIRLATKNIVAEANKLKLTEISIFYERTHVMDTEVIKTIVETAEICDYTFQTYKESKKENSLKKIFLYTTGEVSELDFSVKEGQILGITTNIARDLVNEPANIMTPEELSKRVKEFGKEYGFEVEVLKKDKIDKLGMHAYLAVAKGSVNEPHFIIMKHIGDKKSKENLGLVGKGLTYDSGGLTIKSHEGMLNMKSDMAGSAAVIGAMCAISKMKLEKNVIAVVAACENSIAANCYRPGDIIGSMGGKSIYIKSTDAEGRLTLIDAIHYIINNEKVEKVIDIATLTGAAVSTLGNVASLVVSNDEGLYKQLYNSSLKTGEKIWRMPLFKEYEKQIKHHEADLINSGGMPGAITAGLFIKEFVGDTHWVHIDIAGTAFLKTDKSYFPKGATGVGVRMLYNLIKG